MSQSLSYGQTHKNCINKSSSKQLFSFSKNSRFKYKSQSLTDRISFEKLQENIKNRGYAFPKTRKKLIFHHERQRSNTPPPNLYSSKSQLDVQRIKKSGFSLGMKLKSSMKKLQDFPEPSKYSKMFYSMKKQSEKTFSKAIRKLEFPKENQKGKDSPGPVYTIEMQKLKELVGKYKNPKRTKIVKVLNPEKLRENLKKQQQIQKQRRKRSFFNSIQINKEKMLRDRGRIVTFGSEKRKSIFDRKQQNPGPGKYLTFSEFAKKEKPLSFSKQKLSKLNVKEKTRVKTIK